MPSRYHWLTERTNFTRDTGFLPGIFGGGGAKSIVMKISFVMLIFLLFSDQISGGQKSPKGEGKLHQGEPLPLCGRKPGYGISELTQ